jgi:hypothetical protein
MVGAPAISADAVLYVDEAHAHGLSFWSALALSWTIVLPEYALNVYATRLGYGTYTGAQMASFHLCAGVICVALVSRFVLDEPIEIRHVFGFALLAAGMVLVLKRG